MKTRFGVVLFFAACVSGCGDDDTARPRARDAAADRPNLDGSKSDARTNDAAVDTSVRQDATIDQSNPVDEDAAADAAPDGATATGGSGGAAGGGSGGGGTGGADVDSSVDAATGGTAAADAATDAAVSTFVVGGTISGLSGTVVLGNNGGDNLSRSTNGAFKFATLLANASPYNVTVLTQPTGQSCTVTNGTGTISGANVTNVSVECANILPTTPRFAYVANVDSNTVSMYTVDAQTGQLRHHGYVRAGTNPFSVTLDPASKYAYVANFGGTTLSQFTIGNNGVLAPMSPAAVASGNKPVCVTVDPSGRYAYAANYQDSSVSQYTIGTNGALAPTSPPTVATGLNPNSVAVDPTGKYAYVANYGTTTVSQYTIGTNGALTPMATATVAAGTNPASFAFDPAGKYAYVTNFGSASVSQYTIGTTGALTPMTPSSIAAQTAPVGIAIDPAGKYAYVANDGAGTISQYSIGANGTLAAMSPPTVSAGTIPYWLSIDPAGKFLYATNYGSDTVSRYTIGATGALTPTASTPTITTQDTPASIAIAKGFSPVTYTPKFAYGANSTSVAVFSVDATTGALTKVADVPTGGSTSLVKLHPSGRFIYVLHTAGATISPYFVSTFSIDAASGGLTKVGTDVDVGASPRSMTLDPSGRFAYLLTRTPASVRAFTIDTVTGALSAVAGSQPAVGDDPATITVDPAGRFAYAVGADQGIGMLLPFGINLSTGALITTSTRTVTPQRPFAMTVDPSGRFAYVTLEGNFVIVTPDLFWNRGLVSVYAIDSTAGTLTSGTAFAYGDRPSALAVHPSGRFGFLTNAGQYDRARGDFDTLGSGSALSVDQTTGSLTDLMPTPVVLRDMGAFIVDPSGRFAYVPVGSTLSKFNINQSTGVVTAAGSEAATLGAAFSPFAILGVVQ